MPLTRAVLSTRLPPLSSFFNTPGGDKENKRGVGLFLCRVQYPVSPPFFPRVTAAASRTSGKGPFCPFSPARGSSRVLGRAAARRLSSYATGVPLACLCLLIRRDKRLWQQPVAAFSPAVTGSLPDSVLGRSGTGSASCLPCRVVPHLCE